MKYFMFYARFKVAETHREQAIWAARAQNEDYVVFSEYTRTIFIRTDMIANIFRDSSLRVMKIKLTTDEYIQLRKE